MSHYKCSVSGCQRYAVLKQPFCRYCGMYHCFDHIEDTVSHPCYGMNPKPLVPYRGYKQEYGPLVEKLDLPTIVAQAESLRPGHACKGPDRLVIGERGYTSFIKGGTHLHFPIEFDDGIRWMVRAQKTSKIEPPYEVRKAQVLSEAATFKRLREAGVKVPEVWLPKEWHNGTLYYFVDFVEGAYHPALNSVEPEQPDDILKTIIRDLADFYISLESVSYRSVGSLTLHHDGALRVGPVIGMNHLNTEAPFHLGPFRSAKERYTAEIDHLLRLIVQEAYCAPSQSLPRYLALLEARALVQGCSEMDDGPTYICHGEPKGDHVLVDERGHITAVIDWDWSYLGCKAEAFAAPWALLSDGYHRFENAMSPREIYLRDTYLGLGRPDLARFVEGSRKWLRLRSVLAGVTSFRGLIATRRAFGQVGPMADEQASETEEEWRQRVITRNPDDENLQKLLAK